MSYFEAVILGIIQGLTEYLPVSSSGHLVLAQELMGVNPEGITLEIVVHIGSLLAVTIYYRRRLLELLKSFITKDNPSARKYAGFLIIGTVPAAVIGLSLEDFFDSMFASPHFTSIFLIGTGVILLSTKFAKRGTDEVSLKTALIIGFAQACAILPGISRSGSTISAGLWSRVDPGKAAEFSFLLSIPAIGGATVLKFNDLLVESSALAGPYLLAGLFSLIFSVAAIHWMLTIVKKGRFELFGYYCFAAGALGLYLFSK
jgi:undecaprenyl-diphosphatase